MTMLAAGVMERLNQEKKGFDFGYLSHIVDNGGTFPFFYPPVYESRAVLQIGQIGQIGQGR